MYDMLKEHPNEMQLNCVSEFSPLSAAHFSLATQHFLANLYLIASAKSHILGVLEATSASGKESIRIIFLLNSLQPCIIIARICEIRGLAKHCVVAVDLFFLVSFLDPNTNSGSRDDQRLYVPDRTPHS